MSFPATIRAAVGAACLDGAGAGRMIRPASSTRTDGTIHVALSSMELSLLGIVAFDPDALPAIRARQRINTIDADDSGTLRHAVPLDAWPEALWRALADVVLGTVEPSATRVDLATRYGPRLIPDPMELSLLVPLTPFELCRGLRAAYPEARARKDSVGARILYLEELEWSHQPIALIPRHALSDAGWEAIGAVLPDPDGRWCWSPALRIAARATLDDEACRHRRALLRIGELHAALHLACELPSLGYDVDGYHRELIDAVHADPVAIDTLRDATEDPGDDLEIVRLALDEACRQWRTPPVERDRIDVARFARPAKRSPVT